MPIWKFNCSRVLLLSVLPWWRETLQTAICCVEWLGRLKHLVTSLDVFGRHSLLREGVLGNGRLVISLFGLHVYITFCKTCKFCSRWHWLRYRRNDQWSWYVDRLGPDIFSKLLIKGHVLHRARAHLKVPGCSLVWNTLLTKQLPMFCRAVWMRLMQGEKRFYLYLDHF